MAPRVGSQEVTAQSQPAASEAAMLGGHPLAAPGPGLSGEPTVPRNLSGCYMQPGTWGFSPTQGHWQGDCV